MIRPVNSSQEPLPKTICECLFNLGTFQSIGFHIDFDTKALVMEQRSMDNDKTALSRTEFLDLDNLITNQGPAEDTIVEHINEGWRVITQAQALERGISNESQNND